MRGISRPLVRAACLWEHGNARFFNSDWCPRRDSNPEPTDYESAALTVELQGLTIVVGKGVILAEMCAGSKSEYQHLRHHRSSVLECVLKKRGHTERD